MAKKNPIDHIFSDGLSGYQEPMFPSDWDQMEKRIVRNSASRNKTIWLWFFGICLSGASFLGGYFFKQNAHVVKESAPLGMLYNKLPENLSVIPPVQVDTSPEMKEKIVYRTIFLPCPNEVERSRMSQILPGEVIPTDSSSINRTNAGIVPSMLELDKPTFEIQGNETENSKSKPIAVFIPKDSIIVLVDTFFKQIDITKNPSPKRTKNALMGIQYLAEKPYGYMDSTEIHEGHGLMTQLYTPDLLKSSQWALYGGTQLGVSFFNSSSQFPVILNTPNGDSGFTYLRLLNVRCDVMGKMEFTGFKRDLIPYIEAGLGIRVFSIQQHVKPQTPVPGYQNQTSDFFNGITLSKFINAGTRIPLADGVSADVSLGFTWGNPLSIASVELAQFKNGNISTTSYSINPMLISAKIGFIFEIKKNVTRKLGEAFPMIPGFIIPSGTTSQPLQIRKLN